MYTNPVEIMIDLLNDIVTATLSNLSDADAPLVSMEKDLLIMNSSQT